MARGNLLPKYEHTTDGILVRVVPKFLHDESRPSRSEYFWAYTVEIENHSDEPWTLTTRHWRIVDAEGRRQVVDGEGVIGQTPRLEPGDAFRYTSGCPLAAPSGVMGGVYDFVSDTGAEMSATIPTFSLDSPYDKAQPS